MLASDIINRAASTLKDVAFTRWSQAFLLESVGVAQRVVVQFRPSANTAVEEHTLVAGTKQTIADTVFRLLAAQRNIKASGAPGRAVVYCDLEVMDNADPDWHTRKTSSTILNWMQDGRDDQTFWVYPPALAGTKVECLNSKLPAAPSAIGETLTLRDEYADVLYEYVLYLAYSREADYANHGQADIHLNNFTRMMTGKPTLEYKALAQSNSQGAQQNISDTMGAA